MEIVLWFVVTDCTAKIVTILYLLTLHRKTEIVRCCSTYSACNTVRWRSVQYCTCSVYRWRSIGDVARVIRVEYCCCWRRRAGESRRVLLLLASGNSLVEYCCCWHVGVPLWVLLLLDASDGRIVLSIAAARVRRFADWVLQLLGASGGRFALSIAAALFADCALAFAIRRLRSGVFYRAITGSSSGFI